MSKKLVLKTVARVGNKVSFWNFGSKARVAVGAAIMLAGASTATAAVGVIDTFDDADLSQYTLTKVLDQNAGTSNISFSSPSGALSVQSTGTTAPSRCCSSATTSRWGSANSFWLTCPPWSEAPRPTTATSALP